MRKNDILLIFIFKISTENLIPIVADMESNSITMETSEEIFSNETLDNDIITAINFTKEGQTIWNRILIR